MVFCIRSRLSYLRFSSRYFCWKSYIEGEELLFKLMLESLYFRRFSKEVNQNAIIIVDSASPPKRTNSPEVGFAFPMLVLLGWLMGLKD